MQATVSTAAVALSWSLQAALTAGIAVAGAGVAITFRRPAMRALAVVFILLTVASTILWVGLSAESYGFSTLTVAILLALAPPITPCVASLYYRQIIRLMSGQASDAMPPTRLVVIVGAAGLLVFVGVAVVGEAVSPGRPLGVALLGTVGAVLACVWLWFLAAWARKLPGARRGPLLMLQLSFIALAMRSGVNIYVAAHALVTGGRPDFPVSVIVAQVFLLAAASVLQLGAVLDEERAHGAQQAEQLREAERSMAASQRLESLGRMAGAVAHDFNNVLTVISMSAQSAIRANGADVREDLQEIGDSALRGKALTEQLLAYARQTPQQVTRFDARAQVAKLRGLLERVAGKSAALTVEADDDLQLVDLDVTQFEQVVMNLVLNARDAIKSGGAISIRTGSSATDPAAFVSISISDTGAGIPAAVLSHIFEPFYSTKKEGEGTGLGLAICDGIVRAAGGRIEVESLEGKGTTFDVLLPRASKK